MDGLEGPVEGSGRAVPVLARHIDDLHAPALEIHGGQGHLPPADVLGQGNSRHIGEHPLEMVGGTTGDPPQLIHVDFLRQMLLDIAYCVIQALDPFHDLISNLFACSYYTIAAGLFSSLFLHGKERCFHYVIA